MESLLEYLHKFGTLSKEDIDILSRYTRHGSLSAGDFFLKPGQTCQSVGFILSGVFRIYILNEDGKEITRAFPAERQFIVDLESYSNQKASIEHCEALTETEFIYWDRIDLLRMETEMTSWNAIVPIMTQHILLSATNERTEMFNDNATTRYGKFMDRYPHIVARAPLRLIANYLGIAPQSLSRIRQQLVRN